MKKIAVAIILYNPNVDVLSENIKKLNESVDSIFLIDNNSSNIKDIEKITKFKNVELIKNKKNEGIAKALNIALNKALKNYDYLLTLDQDSIVNYTMIKELYDNSSSDIAIVCPRIIDLNRKKQKKYKGEKEFIDRCITSGSLMNLYVCKKIGLFDEKMFIDYVDFDYCKRIMVDGYKILRMNNICMQHEVGKRSCRKFLFINVFPTNHNPTRVYYYIRNIKYYIKKHKKNMNIKEIIKEYITIYWKLISIIVYESDKKEKIKSFIKGYKDYKKM